MWIPLPSVEFWCGGYISTLWLHLSYLYGCHSDGTREHNREKMKPQTSGTPECPNGFQMSPRWVDDPKVTVIPYVCQFLSFDVDNTLPNDIPILKSRKILYFTPQWETTVKKITIYHLSNYVQIPLNVSTFSSGRHPCCNLYFRPSCISVYNSFNRDWPHPTIPSTQTSLIFQVRLSL